MVDLDSMLKRILSAQVYAVAEETPLQRVPRLSDRLGNHVWLKREDLQPVFSFKLRGAYNCMSRLTPEQRSCGVIACSAGNHAQGVALSAARLKCNAHIVMPVTTPSIKVDAVRKHGAEVILYGDSFDAALIEAQRLVAAKGWTMIHPYDDLDVIAGQGTIGMELLRQLMGPIDAIFIAIGGGGLAAGIGSYIKALRPDIQIIGVEPADAASMQAAFAAGEPVPLDEVGIFADGVAVRQAGAHTYAYCKEVVDEIITVDTDAICAAIKDVFEDTRSILEPAGALSVAGLKAYVAREHVKGQSFIAIACGANMNFDRLRHVSERADIGELREGLFAATIPETPGSFRAFCHLLDDANITEFNYRYADQQQAHVFVGIQLDNAARLADLLERLEGNDIATLDLSDNEMAKLHLRHLVGGHASQSGDERLYRFQFPERPGALMTFLAKLPERCNISLFHYRNHGAAYGRVLCGLQIPPDGKEAFEAFLQDVGYASWDESENPAYRLFLG